MDDINKVAGTTVTFNIPDTEKLGKLETLEPNLNLNLSYRKEEVWESDYRDKPIRAYYMGMKQIPNENGELVLCAIFVTKVDTFLAGGVILIDRLKELAPETPIELTYRGTKENKKDPNKKMLTFDIKRLG